MCSLESCLQMIAACTNYMSGYKFRNKYFQWGYKIKYWNNTLNSNK